MGNQPERLAGESKDMQRRFRAICLKNILKLYVEKHVEAIVRTKFSGLTKCTKRAETDKFDKYGKYDKYGKTDKAVKYVKSGKYDKTNNEKTNNEKQKIITPKSASRCYISGCAARIYNDIGNYAALL